MEYSLKKDKFKSMLIKLLPYTFLYLLIPSAVILFLNSTFKDIGGTNFLLIIAFIVFLYNLSKELLKIFKIRRDWNSFKIIISDNSIIRKQDKTEDIEIKLEELNRIIKVAGGTSVQSLDSNRSIFIPSDLDNYEDMLSRLNTLCTIEISPISSINIPQSYALNQHVKPTDIVKKAFKGIGYVAIAFIGVFIVLLGLIYFLSI